MVIPNSKNSPLVTMGRPTFASKITPFRLPIPKPHYLPHPRTRPTYHAKQHTDPIRRFSTMHWTGRQTDRPTDGCRESLITIGRYRTSTPPISSPFHSVNQCISIRHVCPVHHEHTAVALAVTLVLFIHDSASQTPFFSNFHDQHQKASPINPKDSRTDCLLFCSTNFFSPHSRSSET